MGKKYHCEYCNRQFRDTAEDRRKHRQSAAHRAARIDFEIETLRRFNTEYHHRFGESINSLFSAHERRLLSEVIEKPRACKFHHHHQQHNQLLSAANSSSSTRCQYGNYRCKNSHLLDEHELEYYRTEFLNRLSSSRQFSSSCSSILGIADRPSSGNTTTFACNYRSKRQLKKIIYTNLWLEKRFHFDNRSNRLIDELAAASRRPQQHFSNQLW